MTPVSSMPVSPSHRADTRIHQAVARAITVAPLPSSGLREGPDRANGRVLPMDHRSGNINDVTGMLAALEQGDLQVAESLLDIVYNDLRRLAASKMMREAPGQTIQPTALAHDAWLRLLGAKYPHFENRAHFFSAAAEVMRRILIDRARRRQAARHGGGCERVNVDECDVSAPEPDDQLLAVHDALNKLARKHPRQAEVVKLRYFAGMTNEETAAALEVSVATVKNDWTFARAWIFKEIGRR